MTYIEKTANINNARSHLQICETYFPEKINECVNNTKLYDINFRCDKPNKGLNTFVDVIDATTTDTLKMFYKEGKTAILNFASYKEPGGRFLGGSMAQEESICHESILYSILSRLPEFYKWNNKNKNKGLYMNRALYTPDILFTSDKTYKNLYLGDVITCAAPSRNASVMYKQATEEENEVELLDRITFVLDVAKDNDVEILILGAFGCGVFGQKPEVVAHLFHDRLCSTHFGCFKKVIFAVPSSNVTNYLAFKNEFKEVDGKWIS